MSGERNAELFARAQWVAPGGVHSPVRSFSRVGGTPLFVERAQGSRIEDADGRSYLDFCMSFGPLILGHRHPAVARAVSDALDRGWSFGTAERASLELAELICARLPWVERLRFVNSGTEAVMTALRIARAATRRSKVLKFEGCYHGHADAMLVRAGSGLAGTAAADSAGVTHGVSGDTLVAPLDDEETLRRVFDAAGDELAAAIIEPVPANYGLLPQRPEFLDALAWLCQQHGTLLIFDEVITGFRLGFGGFAEQSGIRPDLVTYGKVIGGGFPVGAYAGRRELMDLVAPVGPVYQAGTLAANPVTMAAGFATLSQLADGTAYLALEDNGRALEQALTGIEGLRVQRVGSIFWLCPGATERTIRSPGQFPSGLPERFGALFHALLDEGIYLPPSPYEVGFLATAHSDEDIAELASAVRRHA